MILEVARYRHEIDGRVFAIEFEEAGVQRLVRGEIKIVGGKRVHERVEDAVTDKNAPQNGLFGLNAVGGDSTKQIVRRPIGIGRGCHAEIPLLGTREKEEQRSPPPSRRPR